MTVANDTKVNLLLVDDQPAKLLSYEVILRDLDATLYKAASAQEALELLLKHEFAVVLIDVYMPEFDGFELAAMIREHPRFERIAIIFISAVLLDDSARVRGYDMGAVDYVPVPVIPEVLRAKVRVFADLYRKTRQLEQLNEELEQRVADRTAELAASNNRLLESEQRRSLALAAGQMGAWDWDVVTGECLWDEGQYGIFGQDDGFHPTFEEIRRFIHPEDLERIKGMMHEIGASPTFQIEARILRPTGEVRTCICAGAMTRNSAGHVTRVSGVSIDITERKKAEERQMLLAREVDHRARNALAVVQAIVRLTKAGSAPNYVAAVEGRIRALSHAHTLLSQSRWEGADIAKLVDEELAPYRSADGARIVLAGPSVFLEPDKAQTLALALHELATNSVKYGALSATDGKLEVRWRLDRGVTSLSWRESGGPPVRAPSEQGFGTRIINASIKHQMGGDVLLDWRPEGLHCTLSLPSKAAGNGAAEATAEKMSNLVQLSNGSRKRVMLVEDEALVGMMMRDMLLDMGFFVVGPFCSVEEARGGVDTQQFDCAILDLNLRGEMVFPIAAVLEQRGKPFAFVTGYGPENIDKRFAHVAVMQKPIAREMLETLLGRLLETDIPKTYGAAIPTEQIGAATGI